ncbi:2833_t:CDS:2 [Entrophospora sp. SA101]|nr:2833_t:CDS:2 [Entrophospora sp. SA101]
MAHEIAHAEKISMTKLEIRKNWENQVQNKHDYAELIKLYNRLDNAQKIEFQQKLTSLLKKLILTQQIEECLLSLTKNTTNECLLIRNYF